MRRAAKVDTNQGDIVRALRRAGASVQSLASVGKGVPDLLVGIRGEVYLLEVKQPKGELTPDQRLWHCAWRGRPVTVVYTPVDALETIGIRIGNLGTHRAFDIDIYDCPCGHMYGAHEYSWLGTAVHPEKAMVIVRCETCDAATRFVAPEQNRPLGELSEGQGKSKAPGGKSTDSPGKSVPR